MPMKFMSIPRLNSLLPPIAAISATISIATLITTSVELYYTVYFLSNACGYVGDRCVDFFIVGWALAIPISLLTTAYAAALYHLHCAGRLRCRLSAVGFGVCIAALWFALLLVGWGPAGDGRSTGAVVEGRLAFVDQYSYISPAGMFRWCVDYYNDVVVGTAAHFQEARELGLVEPARAGMAAVVLCTLSFCWSVLMPLFLLGYQYSSGIRLEVGKARKCKALEFQV